MQVLEDETTNVSEANQAVLRFQLEVHLRLGRLVLQYPAIWSAHAYVYTYMWASIAPEIFLFSELGLNPYDVRRKCDHRIDGPLCYKQIGWIETWMNDRATKVALGANPDRDFQACNSAVNRAFMMEGDGVRNAAGLLPELINSGIRLLVYAGNAGQSCWSFGAVVSCTAGC